MKIETVNAGYWPVRCKNCYTRRTLNRNPANYQRIPRCKCCGCNQYYVDWNRKRDGIKARGNVKCFCDGYIFPHLRGLGNCKHREQHKAEVLDRKIEKALNAPDNKTITTDIEPDF